jgi:hypothetical protein
MSRTKRVIAALAATVATVFGSLLAVSVSASAAVTTVSATTQISNRPDNGHGTPAVWASDSMKRVLSVTTAPTNDCTSIPAFNASTDNCYDATITDTGTFTTILAAGDPSGSGGQISHALTGQLSGTYSLTAFAPSADALTGTVPATEDDHNATPSVSTTNWLTQAFATPSSVVVSGGAYSWTYTSVCEHWTDSSANGDGTDSSAGNITGTVYCAVATSAPFQVQNRATGQCLNENQANGLLSTFACQALVYASLRWVNVTYSDGTHALVSVQTGKAVRDNGSNAQLSLTSSPSPMLFQSGGLLRLSASSLLVGLYQRGPFVPALGTPSFGTLNNVRWNLISF